jgi:hypothetical protein
MTDAIEMRMVIPFSAFENLFQRLKNELIREIWRPSDSVVAFQ